MNRPLFEHRGFMLDVCRHYMPVEDIKRMLDAAELCGMNRMHWHLTDDQGWRIEIKKYPLLTAVGANRGPSTFGDVSATENNCGFYTHSQIREVVAHARRRGIEVIPEIEIPGHACALLAAYPQLGCRRTVWEGGAPEDVEANYPHEVRTASGIYPDLACAGRDEPIAFLKDVLDEVVALFPFPMVHIGGDEAPKLHWRRCPDCQRRMWEQGLETEDTLQRWLVLQMGEYLAAKGRSTIVWNDVLAGGLLPSHFIVQQWRGNPRLTRDFLASGGRVIVSDTDNYYYDYPYGRIDVRHIWNYPLTPPYAEGYESGVLGVECPLWTERVTNTPRAAHMLFPRMTAVGLRLNGAQADSWEAFADQVRKTQSRIDALGLVGAPESCWSMSEAEAAADRAEDDARRYAPIAMPAHLWEVRMLRQEALERLLEAIDMPRPFACLVRDCALGGLEGYEARVPREVRGADALAEQLLQTVENRENGVWRDVEEAVWIDTMKCYSRFVREYFASHGEYGFDRGFWTPRQVRGELFRLGELEYQLSQGENGEARVALHIPSDARLEPELLNASVEKARAFIRERFPKWEDAPMRLNSWLLSSELERLLPPTSRILRFQSAFERTGVREPSDDVLQWVFGLAEDQKPAARLENLPEDTALRRSMKALLLQGGHVDVEEGVLKRSFE